MLGKLFQKSNNPLLSSQQSSTQETAQNVAFQVSVHYGIPSTASNLAYDPIQHLVAIGTLDGRIKVIGGDNVEGLLMSPKSMPFKHLEFLQNQGFLVSVTNENEIQVWDLENRCISSSLLWESHITAFSVIYGTQFIYVGDEYGFLSVLKYDAEERKLEHLPYHVPANVLAETDDATFSHDQSIVGVFAQPSSSGNRVLIAYEHGLIVLWDVTEDRAVLVRGCKDLELKDETLTGNPNDGVHGHGDDLFDEQEGKEISSLCWLSADGSLLAVGYVDGDILIWNLSVSDSGTDDPTLKSSNKVIKLQLSSGDRRLPVIVLHWSPNKAQNNCRGQLFVYGGEEIGSEEVLTVLDLDWSSGIATVKCVHRVDLPLSGSFADMIVLGTSHDLEQKGAASLLILTNPGQLLYYDNDSLSALKATPDKKHSVPAIQYPATVPTVEPHLTVGKLHSVVKSGVKFSTLSETVPAVKNSQTRGREWPLTGGVPYQPSRTEDKGIKRIYIAGYQDGTVRVWDATFPVLSLLLVFQVEVKGIEIPGVNAPISTLEFSSTSSALAIGNEFGLVCIYFLDQNSDKSSLTVVTQTQREVHNLPTQNGRHCTAIFSLVNSPVHCLHWVSPGRRLAVGFECGQVAMLDITSMSVLYVTDIMSGSSVISFAMKTTTLPDEIDSSKNQTEGGISNEPLKEVAVVLTRDAHIILMDIATGKMIHQPMNAKKASAITMCFLDDNASVAERSEEDSQSQKPSQVGEDETQLVGESDWVAVGGHKHSKSVDTTIFLCCEKKLRLYSFNSVIQGNLKAVSKLKLLKPCIWATVFKKDTTGHGLIIVYQSGELEIRSLPDFKVLGSTALMSLLRWNARTNMEKKMSSEKGNLTLVHGSEFAILSLSAFENSFRIPEALPCLHDKVLAAAAEAAVNSHHHKNKQNVLEGLIKGLKGNKKDTNNSDSGTHVVAHLDKIFSRFPFSDPLKNGPDDQNIIELNIDDITIDEPAPLPSPPVTTKVDKKDKGTEREKLFEGGSSDTKPRTRTREEIIAKYRKTDATSAASAASQAKNKLLERGEKLEKLSERTEELSSGAENFASLAQELAKQMERRNKWWKI